MTKPRVILIAGSNNGQGRDVLDALLINDDTELIGILDDNYQDNSSVKEIFGVPVIGPVDAWKDYLNNPPGETRFVLAIPDSKKRAQLGNEMLSRGAQFHSVIHKSAIISPRANLGKGLCILAGCVVAPNATLGEFTILNANCCVDHDCLLGQAVQFGPGVSLAGGVEIGDFVNVGVGVSMMPGVKVGKGAVVGAGAVVVRDVEEGVTAVGNPARALLKKKGGGVGKSSL